MQEDPSQDCRHVTTTYNHRSRTASPFTLKRCNQMSCNQGPDVVQHPVTDATSAWLRSSSASGRCSTSKTAARVSGPWPSHGRPRQREIQPWPSPGCGHLGAGPAKIHSFPFIHSLCLSQPHCTSFHNGNELFQIKNNFRNK